MKGVNEAIHERIQPGQYPEDVFGKRAVGALDSYTQKPKASQEAQQSGPKPPALAPPKEQQVDKKEEPCSGNSQIDSPVH